ncbi:tetratricopeptide repeat protein, partial [Duganella sp. FT92W]
RAAAQAAAEQDQPRRDPARVRLAVLGGALALVAGTLAGVYWYALTSPGPGAHLPPVPMPPPGATTGPAPVAVVPPPSSLPSGDGEASLPAPATPDATAPGAPYTTQDRLQPARGHTGLPQARTALPGQPHSASRMPSDDDLQRALQQQAPAVAAPPPAPAAPPQAAKPAANAGNAANPGNADGAATALNTGVTDIHVLRSVTPQRVNANLQDGYQSFMAGDYATAAQHYATVLRQDSNNRDALLGIAAIAARRNDTAAATSGYQRLLELNPGDPDAQAGLLALRPGDLGHSEMRLKEMLRRDPGAGPLEFALGNLYSQQGRWPDAQQAYFRAYSAAPDNPDYAFNLAVGLDRLSQRKLALSYYQRALDLSRTSPAAFDRNAAKRRAEQLAVEKP